MSKSTPAPHPRILHMAGKSLFPRVWTTLFREELGRIGPLRVEEGTQDWPDAQVAALAREHDVLLINWESRPLPECLAENPGRLKYICNLSGEIRPYVPRAFIERGFAVTNWGDHPAFGVGEGALAMLLTVLKQVIPQREAIRRGGWSPDCLEWRGSVRDLRIGVYGLGVIGRAFVELARPLQPRLSAFDPYLENWPPDVRRMDDLDALFSSIEAVIITAALTDQTRGSVHAERLARLPDGGIVINVARGAIIDQDALFAELERGRLRAGLDVLDSGGKDFAEPGHPCRQWPNLLLTGHTISRNPWNEKLYNANRLTRLQRLGIDNLRRFVLGKPLQFTFDTARYDRST
jgi:phosphoglycerate dehydrogenase-like enzyme